MGIGVDLIRYESPEAAAIIDNFKEQLLIVLINRLGGVVDIPVEEVDDTGQYIAKLRVDVDMIVGSDSKGVFHFEVTKKS